VQTAQAITEAPAAGPGAPARPAPETPPPAEPALPTAEIVEGDVVYGGDGRSYRVVDASHPNRLTVIRQEDGREMFVPRAAMRKAPPPPIVREPVPAPAYETPTQPGSPVASRSRDVEQQIIGALQQVAGEAARPEAAPSAAVPTDPLTSARRSLEMTGTARVGDYTFRIITHPSVSGFPEGEAFTVEIINPAGQRQTLTEAPMSMEAARERALQIAQDVLRERTERPTAPPSAQAAAPATEAARPVTVQRVRPASELTTEELVARVKAEAPDPQVGYGIFVRY